MFILIPFGIAFFLTIGGFVVSWLWNALLPGLFSLPQISFWQALGILALARILFGGFGGGGSRGPGRHGMHRRHGGPRGHFSAEERERIRQQLNMDASEDDEADSGEED
jgi:hypothetical protein